MNLTDLPNAFEKLWSFIVPPFLKSVVVLVLVLFVAGAFPPQGMLVVVPEAPKGPFREFLDFYGLSSMIPVACLLILVGLFRIVSQIVSLVGAIMPGALAFPVNLLLYGNADDLAHLLATYENAHDLNDLDHIIENEVQKTLLVDKKDSPFWTASQLRSHIDRLSDRFTFIKGCIAIVCVTAILSLSLSLSNLPSSSILMRLTLGLLILGAAALACVANMIRTYRYYSNSKVAAAIVSHLSKTDGEKCSLTAEQSKLICDDLRARLAKHNDDRCWRFMFLAPSSERVDFRNLMEAFGIRSNRQDRLELYEGQLASLRYLRRDIDGKVSKDDLNTTS